jgi:hypothetical protein
MLNTSRQTCFEIRNSSVNIRFFESSLWNL